MHFLRSMLGSLFFIVMALAGQSFAHRPQPMHSLFTAAGLEAITIFINARVTPRVSFTEVISCRGVSSQSFIMNASALP